MGIPAVFKIITLVSPAHMEAEFSAALGKPLHLKKKVFSVIRNGTAVAVTKGENYLPYKEQLNKLGVFYLKSDE